MDFSRKLYCLYEIKQGGAIRVVPCNSTHLNVHGGMPGHENVVWVMTTNFDTENLKWLTSPLVKAARTEVDLAAQWGVAACPPRYRIPLGGAL